MTKPHDDRVFIARRALIFDEPHSPLFRKRLDWQIVKREQRVKTSVSEDRMVKTTGASGAGRRNRTGGIVREKLDLLMSEHTREPIPDRLIELALELQSAIKEKSAREKDA